MADIIDQLKAYSGQPTREFCALGATGRMIWDAVDEIERLRAELEWWKQQPTHQCDSKCDYGKKGDPNGCYCGRAQWDAKKPNQQLQGDSNG